MGILKRAADLTYAFRFIRMMVMDWKSWDAYKLGIIDDKGKVLKKRSTLRTKEEKDAYTLTDTMIFNLKIIYNHLKISQKSLQKVFA